MSQNLYICWLLVVYFNLKYVKHTSNSCHTSNCRHIKTVITQEFWKHDKNLCAENQLGLELHKLTNIISFQCLNVEYLHRWCRSDTAIFILLLLYECLYSKHHNSRQHPLWRLTLCNVKFFIPLDVALFWLLVSLNNQKTVYMLMFYDPICILHYLRVCCVYCTAVCFSMCDTCMRVCTYILVPFSFLIPTEISVYLCHLIYIIVFQEIMPPPF